MKLPEVNLKLLPPKLHYLLYFGGVAAFWPYLTVFGKQLGISESNVGYIFTIAPIAGIIAMPLFGSIADRFKAKKKLFLVSNLINIFAILCFAILTVTEKKVHRPVVISCGVGTSFVEHCHHDNDTKWNSTLIREKILEELSQKDYPIVCAVDCIVSQVEKNEFCSALLNGTTNQPPELCSSESADDSIPVSLKTKLDFTKTTALESCLYMEIENVVELGVESGNLTARSLSCFPHVKLSRCQIHCPDLPSANKALEMVESEKNDTRFSTVFSLYAFFTIVAWIAMAVVTFVADALCFQTLGDRPDLYGAQRKWGSIGWGLFTLISGFLVDLVSGDSLIKDYTPCYWVAGILLTLNFIVCWKWDVVEEEKPKALGRRMVALILEPKITVFIMACIVVGICTGLLWNFLFWYIEDLATSRMGMTMESTKWIKLLQGLISITQCFLGELPFFYFAGKFINKFGHVNSMAIVIGSFGIRFLLYSILQNPWWVLPIELFQGLTYGIFYTNMATYAYVVSPEGTAATVQGVVGSAFEGIGVSIGSLFGGLMYQYWSGRTTFRIFGIFSLLMCVLYKGVMTTLDRKFEPLSQHTGGDSNFGTEMKQMERPT